MKTCHGDEEAVIKKIKRKYMDEFLHTDLHFFLGTTQQFHTVAPNPWVIIGVFPVPHKIQNELFWAHTACRQSAVMRVKAGSIKNTFMQGGVVHEKPI